MTLSMIAFWMFLTGIAAWGSFHFSTRDRRSVSLMKMAFASTLLVMFGASLVLLRLPPDVIGEGLLAHAMLFIFWPMTAIALRRIDYRHPGGTVCCSQS